MDTPAKPDDLSDMGPSPFELELYGSLTNALNVLRGSAPSAIVWSIVRGLNPFPQNIAFKVSNEATWRLERNAVPRDFVELARQFYGVTKADLLAQGRVAFYKLLSLEVPQYDLICSNWRVVYAIKRDAIFLVLTARSSNAKALPSSAQFLRHRAAVHTAR